MNDGQLLIYHLGGSCDDQLWDDAVAGVRVHLKRVNFTIKTAHRTQRER
jgi:hypothetical protein